MNQLRDFTCVRSVCRLRRCVGKIDVMPCLPSHNRQRYVVVLRPSPHQQTLIWYPLKLFAGIPSQLREVLQNVGHEDLTVILGLPNVSRHMHAHAINQIPVLPAKV